VEVEMRKAPSSEFLELVQNRGRAIHLSKIKYHLACALWKRVPYESKYGFALVGTADVKVEIVKVEIDKD